MLLYKDGNMGFIDTTEWLENNRQVKVIEKGINTLIADKLGAVIEDIPEKLLVSDTRGYLGIIDTKSIKRKFRTAKTRVFSVKQGVEINGYAGLTKDETINYLPAYEEFEGKLKKVTSKYEINTAIVEFKDCYC